MVRAPEPRSVGREVGGEGLAWASSGLAEGGLGGVFIADVGGNAGEVGRLAERPLRPVKLKVVVAVGGTMGAVSDEEAMLGTRIVGIGMDGMLFGGRTSRMMFAQLVRSLGSW